MLYPGDTSPPLVTIQKSNVLYLSGVCEDDCDITDVRWFVYEGESGPCQGTAHWKTVGLQLKPGANLITICAYDSAGNVGAHAVFVTNRFGAAGRLWSADWVDGRTLRFWGTVIEVYQGTQATVQTGRGYMSIRGLDVMTMPGSFISFDVVWKLSQEELSAIPSSTKEWKR